MPNPTTIGRAARANIDRGITHPVAAKRHEAGGGVQNRKRPLLQAPGTNVAPVTTIAPAARELARRAEAQKPATSKPKAKERKP